MNDEQQPLIGLPSKTYSSGEPVAPTPHTSSSLVPQVTVVNSMSRPGRSSSEPGYQSFDADGNANETSHCHDGQTEESDEIRKGNIQARRKLIIASIFCLVFMIAETIGGAVANSLAIMTDAAHLLTDFASFMISLLALYIASRPATKRMSYGWHRAEVVGAIVSVLLIWVVTGILVYLAIMRIVNKEFEINGLAMLITSAFGIGVNIIMGLTLHQHSHGHGHDHDHDHGHSHSHGQKKESEARTPTAGGSQQQTPRPHDHDHDHGHHNHSHDHDHSHDHAHDHAHKHDHGPAGHHNHEHNHPAGEHAHDGNNQDVERGLTSSLTASAEQLNSGSGGKKKPRDDVNINVRAAFIHVLGDLLQSVGVFIAALIIYFKPEYKIADPICTFIFSILVLITTINILRDALNVIMEATPHGLDFNDVRDTLLAVPGVRAVHNLRLWSLTMNKTAMSAHLAIAKKYDQQAVLKRAMNDVKEKFGIVEVTIQIEEHSIVMDRCAHCTPPAH